MSFTLNRVDRAEISKEPGEIRALIVARNERKRLAWLINYYKELGVDRFLVVDNDSDDGSIDYLLAQQNVHVWHTKDSYGASQYGRYWLDQIRAEHGLGHWCLVVDADEVLVFPFSEQLTIRDIVKYMSENGYRGLFTFMLDMYPAGPLREAELAEGQNFLEVADHFDAGPYFVMPATERFPILSVNGGLRRRIFFQSGMVGRGPNIRKVPLILWQPGDAYKSAHSCNDVPLADITGVLLHFKYFSDFHEKAIIEAQRKEHKSGGDEYAIYMRLLSEMPDISFMSELSRRYTSSLDLVKMQLIFCSSAYLKFVQSVIELRNGDNSDFAELAEIRQLLGGWDSNLRLPLGALSRLWKIPSIR